MGLPGQKAQQAGKASVPAAQAPPVGRTTFFRFSHTPMTTVTLTQLFNFSTAQRQRAEHVRQVLEDTLNSVGFQAAVRAATFLDVRRERPDGTVVSDLTNEQILQVVLTGEESGTAPDGDLALRVQLYHRPFSSAIGYSAGGIIYTRHQFFDGFTLAEVAGHWLHEWSHAAGFLHDYDRTSRRDQSVSYLLGELLIDYAAPPIPAATAVPLAAFQPLPTAALSSFYSTVITASPLFNSEVRVATLDLLEPTFRRKVQGVLADAAVQGVPLMVFETYRSQARQAQLFREGKSKLATVGTHHYGLAADIVFVRGGEPSWDGDFGFLGHLIRAQGLIWGGDWGHPQRPNSFPDEDHAQWCTVGRQAALFRGEWYPGPDYDPYQEV